MPPSSTCSSATSTATPRTPRFCTSAGAGQGPPPRYDVLPTRLDATLTEAFAFRIGAATRLDEVTAEHFDAFLAALGIASPAARHRLRRAQADDIAERIAAHLDAIGAASKPLADLIAANMRMLLPAFGCVVPAAARERDALATRGGGWALS